MSRPVHLGLDIGGTASRWVACTPDGEVLGRGKVSGATGHIFNPAEKDRLDAVLRAVRQALGDAGLEPVSITAGITGYGSAVAVEVAALVEAIFAVDAAAILLIDDIVLAYVAHFAPGQGHLVSAGTGSIGIHVTATGDTVRVGGRGILIDDAGSGSWIALEALDRLYRILDRDGSFAAAQPLADHLFALVGGREWHDVRQFIYGGDRGRIGTLAVAVGRAAGEGDALAQAILRQAGVELAQLGSALLSRAGDHPLRFVGGVLDLHPAIFTEITASLAGHDVSRAEGDAALAAAQLQAGRHRAWMALLTRQLPAN
jgi:N-acetylglucosamine kinase-like BadF-type ATPase